MKSIQNQPHILIIKFVKYNASIFNKTTYTILYTGIFLACVIFALLHLQAVLSCIEFAQTQLC